MQRKTLFYALMLCLVMMISAACSPAAGPADNDRPFGTLTYNKNNVYHNPSGPYDDDKGFKNDFVLADLNPNLVTGRNDLYNLDADERIMAQIAANVRGVERATAYLNGGTAHVNIDIEGGADKAAVRAAVYQQLQLKMPRYSIDLEVRR
ncbi:hypothetical protein [Ammoniphilus sp. 3BR4]|uniref:hypothetical protein n=1 Tax=Ammoniphilus sp. 3BR4 TaxID=3158265 RepID=UPI003466BB07